MPIYQLDDLRADLPEEGRYWIAETAVLIGRVRLKPVSYTHLTLPTIYSV